jgi:calcineurin-like phosphoesterase family protein
MSQLRGFQDEFYHDEHLIEEWNKVVHKKDLTYILGDITMETPDHYYQLDRLKGRKIVVLGNHDRHQDIKELLGYVDGVSGMIDYKGFILTHAPIHPNEISLCSGNIHAHIHHNSKLEEVEITDRYGDGDGKKILTQNKYFNVDAHLINYKPKTIEELLNQRIGDGI